MDRQIHSTLNMKRGALTTSPAPANANPDASQHAHAGSTGAVRGKPAPPSKKRSHRKENRRNVPTTATRILPPRAAAGRYAVASPPVPIASNPKRKRSKGSFDDAIEARDAKRNRSLLLADVVAGEVDNTHPGLTVEPSSAANRVIEWVAETRENSILSPVPSEFSPLDLDLDLPARENPIPLKQKTHQAEPTTPPGTSAAGPPSEPDSDQTTQLDSSSPVTVRSSNHPKLEKAQLPQESSACDLLTIEDEGERLKDIARRLLATQPKEKPTPAGQPEVWADSRMELCETLYYYRSYQGSCYATEGFARACMFANNAHPRDYMDGSVVLSRLGGGLSNKGGQWVKSKDQTEGHNVRIIRNSMAQFNPVVLIVADNNPFVPVKPPHMYNVLDYFKITNIWWEKNNGMKILRIRFEKLNRKKASWWQPAGTSEVAKPGSLDPPVMKSCSKCLQMSQQVYAQGWMCLQADCDMFWKLASLQEPEEQSLTYDPRFLKQHTPWPNDDSELPLGSMNAELPDNAVVGEDCSRAHWSGIVCPDCGRCNSRLHWRGWKCENPECSFEKTPSHTLIPASSLHDPFNPLSTSYMYSRDLHSPLVNLSVSFAHNYRINRFTIPGIDGFITHMIANKTVVQEPEGPNDMFECLQRQDIGLARRRMDRDFFTRHYAVNFGMPYKFVAATSSSPFTDSAAPIVNTRSRLNWAAQYILAREHPDKPLASIRAEWKPKEFNEILALGYLEEQKISFHDDGESGLGPTIATLSLGATGTMRIRMKARYHNGVSNAGVYDAQYPLPGCTEYQKRVDLYSDLRKLETQDRKAYTQRLKGIPKQLGLKSGGQAKEAITMTVAHGDIVIMHGAQLQKFYEHSVDHSGKLRFALTCRHIDPLSLSKADQPKWEVLPDEENYDGTKLPVPGQG